MLTRTLGRRISWPVNRLAGLLARAGVPPNVITWGALVLSLQAAILFAAGRFRAGAGIMILAGLCDLLDGPVARREGRVSLFGGFLESILDRYADLMLFLGLLVYYVSVDRFHEAMLAGAAAAGAVMVGYAKARAESLVPVDEVGFWERPERLALMILCGLANRMPLGLWILAIGPNITVIHRILHTWKQTKTEPQRAMGASAVAASGGGQFKEPSPALNVMTRSAGRGR